MFRVASRGWAKYASSSLGSCRFIAYSLPNIPTLGSAKASGDELKGLFSNKGIEELWFKRGQCLVDRLNSNLEENQLKDAPRSLEELIALTINTPELIGVYSYASLLYNLQFSMESLKANESTTAGESPIQKAEAEELLQTSKSDFTNQPMDENLVSWINDSFGSMQEFRTLLLNSAKGIKGDGYTWVVAESSLGESVLRDSAGHFNKSPLFDNLAVVNTYNFGTVDDSLRSGQLTKLKQQKEAKIEAIRRKKEERNKISNQEDPSNVELESLDEAEAFSNSLYLGTIEEAEASSLFSDKKLIPILAIDASPRSYLLDYGVFGKQRFLDNVWECIDWNVVVKRLPQRSKQFVKLD